MNFKDMLLPLSLALLSTWFIQYFFLNKYYADPAAREQVQAGQRFTAPAYEQLQTPLLKEVNFLDKHIPCDGQSIAATMQASQLNFSSCGAALTNYTYAHNVSGQQELLQLLNVDESTREGRAFLVALDTPTPLSFELLRNELVGNQRHIVFKNKNDACTIEKSFVIHQDSYRIDLQLKVSPRSGQSSVKPRIFLPAPFMADSGVPDSSYLKGITVDASANLQKVVLKDVEKDFWVQPACFGVEDKYFLATMINDAQKFTQRAYFKQEGASVQAILEGPEVQEETTWNLSFYYGPKEVAALNAVDPRLEATLEYGWLGPIAKLLMKLLNAIYSYVHNYGWAIIIITLLLKLMLAPVTSRAEKSAHKAAELSKKMKYLEQKYKDDRERLAYEKQELMRKNGVGDMLGCLPMLAQIPVFFALNRALSVSLELYKAPFIGWITDLSARDPYYVIPVLIGTGILMQTSGKQDARQRLTMMMMALVFTGITANLSVGLGLFIAISSWSSIIQTRLQKRFAR